MQARNFPASYTREVPDRKLSIAFVLVVLGLLALDFGMVTLKGSIADTDAESGIKLSYAVFALLGVIVILRGRLVRLRAEMMLFFAATIIPSAVAYFAFPPHHMVVAELITLYVAIIGAVLGAVAGSRGVLRALRLSSVILLVAVVIKDISHAPAFLLFLAHPIDHPIVPTFMVGGVNLEATWVSMAGFFFIGSPLFVPYVVASTAISVLYASRVGVIIGVLVVIASLVRARAAGTVRPSRRPLGYLLAALILVGLATAAGTLLPRGSTALDFVTHRFENIGDDPGSVGRLALWKGGIQVFEEYPFGVGRGNAVPELERILGVDVPEDNVHNLYLQYLIDAGLAGLLAYVIFAAVTWRRLVASRFQDRLLLYVVCYLLICAIQFSGGESLVWFIYGLHTGAYGRG